MSDSGNTRRTARNISFLQGRAIRNETVGLRDRQDLFRVNLNRSSNFTARLTNLTADADVAILGAGRVWENLRSGRRSEVVEAQFEPGTYFIRVLPRTPRRRISYQLELSLLPTNRAPTTVNLSNNVVTENVAVGTQVGLLTTTDPDSADTHTYTLVSGVGGEDNGSFRINGNQLLLATSPNFELKDSYNILLQTVDQGGLSLPQPKGFTISIENIAPTPPTAEIDLWRNNIRRGDDSNLSSAQQVYKRMREVNSLLNPIDKFDSLFSPRGGYYDGGAVFSQIAERATNAADAAYWHGAADLANSLYTDFIKAYVFTGYVQGFNNFSDGLENQHFRAKAAGNANLESQAKDAIALLATGSAYTRFKTNDDAERTDKWFLSREVAYGINTLLSAKRVGLFEESDSYFAELYQNLGSGGAENAINRGLITANDRNVGAELRTRLDELAGFAFNHLEQWFVEEDTDNTLYVQPFMVGLTAKSLIEYVESTPNTLDDLRLTNSLQSGLREMWNEAWIPEGASFQGNVFEGNTFRYIDRIPSSLVRLPGYTASSNPPQTPSNFESLLNPNEGKDLNLLIAPAYEWVYSRTGDEWFLERADEIFKGGVQQAFIGNNKQFNQNYFWSFDYVDGR